MTDIPGADAAAAAIHAAFAKPVRYTGAGLWQETVQAVRSHGPGSVFMEDQQTVRQLAFEILKAALPEEPAKGDTIVEQDGAGDSWSVIEIGDSDEVDAWVLFVDEPE